MSGGGKGGEIMMKVGPRGGSDSGTAWDDLALGDIKIIYISHGSDLINSIQTAHSDSGDGLKLSQKHGGDGDKFDMMFGGFVGKDIMMKVGPRGGSGGAAWDDLDLGNVKKIYISHGSHVVNSIQTAHSNSRNGLMLSEKHGGDGDKFDVVNVDAKDSISWIKGSYTNHDGLIWKPVVITSLTIGFRYGPNYGPFGSEWIYGSPFHFWFAKGSSFCGFHGSADNLYLHSIGVHVKSVHTP
eukprot:TRINITY_DN2000_c0_g1_i2.p1 TRINITY_DN2000_c0_g1~~TRINITY_DN2000_c0_g1_i2.p1  ORF type:complete len:240 (+),score=33.47 TRINITY_DN2000_c0_g1_i2:212-931(+)